MRVGAIGCRGKRLFVFSRFFPMRFCMSMGIGEKRGDWGHEGILLTPVYSLILPASIRFSAGCIVGSSELH